MWEMRVRARAWGLRDKSRDRRFASLDLGERCLMPD